MTQRPDDLWQTLWAADYWQGPAAGSGRCPAAGCAPRGWCGCDLQLATGGVPVLAGPAAWSSCPDGGGPSTIFLSTS